MVYNLIYKSSTLWHLSHNKGRTWWWGCKHRQHQQITAPHSYSHRRSKLNFLLTISLADIVTLSSSCLGSFSMQLARHVGHKRPGQYGHSLISMSCYILACVNWSSCRALLWATICIITTHYTEYLNNKLTFYHNYNFSKTHLCQVVGSMLLLNACWTDLNC